MSVEVTGGNGQGGGDKHFRHQQLTAATVWQITHNLGKYPSVTVLTSAGQNVIGEVEYPSLNTVRITFTQAFAGDVYLN